MLTRREFLASCTLGAGLSVPAAGASGGRMYLSLNSALLVGGKVGWPEFARLAGKVGYPGTDFNLSAAMQEGLGPTRALLDELNVKPAVCGLPVPVTRGDDAAFQEGMKNLPEAARFAADVGCPRMTMVVSPASQIPKEERRKQLKDRLAQVSEALSKYSVRLGMEFLGPQHFRTNAPHVFIYRMDEMLDFAKECGSNIGLLLDVWHWHHAGATIQDILDAGKSRIVTIHLSDAPDLPPDQIRDNQRLLPGEGVIDLVGFFRALKQIGYEDGVSPEVLGRIPKDMPPEDAARLGLEASLTVMRKAGVA